MENIQSTKHTSDGCTNTILMVQPVAFGYNPETAINNFFIRKETFAAQIVQKHALHEFNQMVETFRSHGINVIVLKDKDMPHTPDSIFPNNWVSFHLEGNAVFYPMFAENRRLERRMDILLFVEEQIEQKYELLDLSGNEQYGRFLEGTGSVVLDRVNRIAYACLSARTDKELFLEFCNRMNYRPIYFTATQKVKEERIPVFHTNIMMCIADKYAVVCLETIENERERKMVEDELVNSGKQVVEITLEQMDEFAGNMLQVKNNKGEKLLVMSQSAFNSLTESQIKILGSFNRIIVISIPTIQKNGGGGVRCMMTEVF